jgi:hypothetical protein
MLSRFSVVHGDEVLAIAEDELQNAEGQTSEIKQRKRKEGKGH